MVLLQLGHGMRILNYTLSTLQLQCHGAGFTGWLVGEEESLVLHPSAPGLHCNIQLIIELAHCENQFVHECSQDGFGSSIRFGL